MQHYGHVSARLKALFITGFLIRTVTPILGVRDHGQGIMVTQNLSQGRGMVAGRVIDEQKLIDDALRHVRKGPRQSSFRVLRR